MGKRAVRFVGLIFSVSVILVLTSTASAEDWRTGQAVVMAVDSAAHTITLDDEEFRVPPTCQIRRASGARVPLSMLRVSIRPGVRVVPTNDVDYVHYEAVKKRRGWEMVRITVLDRMPE